jgi:hypothetical protein
MLYNQIFNVKSSIRDKNEKNYDKKDERYPWRKILLLANDEKTWRQCLKAL